MGWFGRRKREKDAIVQKVLGLLSGDHLATVGQMIGADEQATGSALSSVVPLLVLALVKNVSTPQGAEALHQAVTRDHDGSILSDVSGYLANPEAANGAGILGNVLGDKQSAVTEGLAQHTGLSSGQIGRLLIIVAPLVMGELGQQRQQQSLNVTGLTRFVGDQQHLASDQQLRAHQVQMTELAWMFLGNPYSRGQ